MSNWKVGPGGRLYHPTTGAYVGQLDDNGNEQMVVTASPSVRRVRKSTVGSVIVPAGASPNGRMMTIGDSRMDHGVELVSGVLQKKNIGLQYWLPFLTRQKVRCSPSNDFGVAGTRTDEILAALPAILASNGEDIVMGIGGTNDRAAGMTAQQTIDNLAAIFQLLYDAGRWVIWFAEMPRGDSSNTGNRLTSPQLDYHMQVADWLRRQHSPQDRLYIADVWPVIADPASTTGDALTGWLRDGLHPAAKTAHAMSLAAKPAIDMWLPSAPVVVSTNSDIYSASNPRGCLNSNPMLAGSSGTHSTPTPGSSGAMPTGYASNIASAASGITMLYDEETIDGAKWLKIVLGGRPAGSGAVDFLRVTGLQTNVVEGELLEVVAEIRLLNLVNMRSVAACIQTYQSGAAKDVFADGQEHATVTPLPTEDITGVSCYDEAIVPASCTDVRGLLRGYPVITGSDVSGTIYVRTFAVRKAAESNP